MLLRRAALACSLLLAPMVAAAQGFPERPVSLSVGFAPGGSTDIASRLIAERFAANLGANARMLVENRPGASGTVASEWLRRQPADGHNLMLIEVSSHAVVPAALQGGTSFDPITDFTHIGMVGTAPMILVANPNIPGRTAEEVIAHLRTSRNEEIPYATSGVGSIPHFGVEMMAAEIGARFLHVSYRSGGLMLTAIQQGQGQFGIAVLASAAAHVRGGMVRGLAVTSRERFPAFPDIPTLNEGALPGFEMTTWNMIIGPPNMPADRVAQINRALIATVAEPEIQARLIQAGVAPWTAPNTPAGTRAFLQAELEKYRAVVARTGIRLER
jgi:tripartite-type tricarboxylate transporter receptor subunit TctC